MHRVSACPVRDVLPRQASIKIEVGMKYLGDVNQHQGMQPLQANQALQKSFIRDMRQPREGQVLEQRKLSQELKSAVLNGAICTQPLPRNVESTQVLKVRNIQHLTWRGGDVHQLKSDCLHYACTMISPLGNDLCKQRTIAC